MNKGSCHCGSVSFQVDKPLSKVYKCYCETCRKLSGSAFSVVTKVHKNDFNIVRGQDSLHVYESKPGKNRYYCKKCCSPIFVTVQDQPDYVRVRLGVLDGDPKVEIAGHIWLSEKPEWQEIGDSLPKFSGWNA